MNIRSPQMWLGLISLGAVLSVAVVDVRRKAPGQLSLVHARIEDLAGADDCRQCHGGWRQSMQSACLECHEEIDAHLEAGLGLHGTFAAELVERCSLCHGEHHGASFPIVNATSFRLAGVEDASAFDHAIVGFEMSGRHLELACTECHVNAEIEVLPEDAQRFIGLTQNCTPCHEDPHEGVFTASCADCHLQSSFSDLRALGHERVLPLVGGHAEISCRECHADADPHALEVVAGRRAKPTARACADCHESPHDALFLDSIALLEGVDVAHGCVGCHQAEHTSFRDEALAISFEQHASSGFALDAPHDEVSCAGCHGVGVRDHRRGTIAGEAFGERHPGRSAEECSRCHEDVHRGQFAAGAFAGEECSSCHEPLRFEPHAFTVERHERTSMPLQLSHAAAECNDCHERADESAARTFHGTAGTCASCHEDAHGGFFAERQVAVPEPLAAGECSACHRPSKFDDVSEDKFDHGSWTGFAVDGAHAEAGCESCHPRADDADARGRRFGFVRDHFGVFEGCVTCHDDPHEGAFDVEASLTVVAGRRDCARCHVSSSFRSFPEAFAHGTWTGFELRGAHGEASCTACHEPLRGAPRGQRSWARAAGASCAACHDSPHGDQFLTATGHEDCARCHADGTNFAETVFDHDRDSRFPLDEAHEAVACAGCHKSFDQNGQRIVRYKPLSTDCADCHGVQRDQLRRIPGRERR